MTIQQELKAIAGQLRVPTLVIGDEVIDGYSKSAMRRTLLEKGYPIDQIESGSAQVDNATDDQPREQGESENLDESTESMEMGNLEEQVLSEITAESDLDFEPLPETQ